MITLLHHCTVRQSTIVTELEASIMEKEQNILFSGDFEIFPKSNIQYKVLLTSDKLVYVRNRGGMLDYNEGNKIDLSTVIGCHCMKGKIIDDVKSYFTIYWYPIKKKLATSAVRKRMTVTFQVSDFGSYQENLKVSQNWRAAILILMNCTKEKRPTVFNQLLSYGINPGLALPIRKLLVLINPKGGQGKALQIFQERVVPVLAEAGILYCACTTEYANHARVLMSAITPSDWYGIVIISGDGLVHEVYNGLFDRDDWPEALSTPIGTIPGGSGNGLHATLVNMAGLSYSTNFIQHSALVLCRGLAHPMDLVLLETCDNRQIISFLSVTWGIVADIDLESERFRKLGQHRFTLETLAKIAERRVYRGKISYLRASDYTYPPGYSSQTLHRPPPRPHLSHSQSFVARYPGQLGGGGDAGDTDRHSSMQDLTSTATSTSTPPLQLVHTVKASDLILEEDSGHSSSSCNDVDDDDDVDGIDNQGVDEVRASSPPPPARRRMSHDYLRPLGEPLPEGGGWESIEGDFLSVNIIYQPLIGVDTLFVPYARPDDAVMHLVFVEAAASRKALLSIFMGMEDGSHIGVPEFKCVPIKAFRLEPHSKRGVISVDGEHVKYGPIQGEVRPGLARVIAWTQ